MFGREQNQDHARCFVQGLLLPGDRRNTENIAENIQGCNVRNLQAFITTGVWSDSQVLKLMRESLLEQLADEDAVWNCDETGFPKQGTQSVGVKRQYSGTMGRTANCQIAVFANYCSKAGHAFMDRRLFLPTEWVHDQPRRQRPLEPTRVPDQTSSMIIRCWSSTARAVPGKGASQVVRNSWMRCWVEAR